jgi:hypothetical protein
MALAQGRPALLREAFPHMLFVFDDQFGDGVDECVAVLGQAVPADPSSLREWALMWMTIWWNGSRPHRRRISKRDFAIACANYAAVAVRRVSRAISRLTTGRAACPLYVQMF